MLSWSAIWSGRGTESSPASAATRRRAWGAQLLAEIKGDWFAVLGLPLMPLLGFLREHGLVET